MFRTVNKFFYEFLLCSSLCRSLSTLIMISNFLTALFLWWFQSVIFFIHLAESVVVFIDYIYLADSHFHAYVAKFTCSPINIFDGSLDIYLTQLLRTPWISARCIFSSYHFSSCRTPGCFNELLKHYVCSRKRSRDDRTGILEFSAYSSAKYALKGIELWRNGFLKRLQLSNDTHEYAAIQY